MPTPYQLGGRVEQGRIGRGLSSGYSLSESLTEISELTGYQEYQISETHSAANETASLLPPRNFHAATCLRHVAADEMLTLNAAPIPGTARPVQAKKTLASTLLVVT